MSNTFSLSRARAALGHAVPRQEARAVQAVSSASGRVQSSKKKKSAAAVVARGEAVSVAISKYTGLPKGPASAGEQNDYLINWQRRGHTFPKQADIVRERERLKELSVFRVPQGAKTVRRRAGMIECLATVGIEVTDEDICTLALGRGQFRKAYWVCCSLYGHTRRLEHSSKTEKLCEQRVKDSEEVAEARLMLKEQSEALKDCQREWQTRIEALKTANADLLNVMQALTVSTDELRDFLSLPQPAPASSSEEADFRVEGSGDEGEDESEEREEDSEAE